MLFEIENTGNGYSVSSRKIMPRSAADLKLLEKDIEHWIADHPEVLLPNEQVLVIGQSIAGQPMADVLALDSFGRLIVVEIKRDRADRETIAQLLGYAASLYEVSYEELNGIAQRYQKWGDRDLHTVFSEFSDAPDIARDELGKEHRIIIVAPDSDTDLRDIVGWLRHHAVPVEFVPFSIYADEQGASRFLQIEGVTATPDPILTTRSGADIGSSIPTRRMLATHTIACSSGTSQQFSITSTVPRTWREPNPETRYSHTSTRRACARWVRFGTAKYARARASSLTSRATRARTNTIWMLTGK